MKSIVGVVVLALLPSCSKEDTAKQAAKENEELERLEKERAAARAPEVKHPPVVNDAKIPCDQLIDPVAFQTALGEKDAVHVVAGAEAAAAASCSIIKGGRELTKKEQDAIYKKNGSRLGVIPGEEICNIAAFCWTVETAESFSKRCEKNGFPEPTTELGANHPGCIKTVGEGSVDKLVYRFFDDDSGCVLQARGGPRLTDNEVTLTCAKAARDSITPERIHTDAPPPEK